MTKKQHKDSLNFATLGIMGLVVMVLGWLINLVIQNIIQ
jgi:hypothetical protein